MVKRGHVGINAHLLAGTADYRRAGIHHYIAQVLRHLPRDVGLDYTVLTGAGADILPDLRLVGSWWGTERPLARILWEQLVWGPRAVAERFDLVHSMAFALPPWLPCPAVVTIYDLSFIHYPERFPALKRLYLRWQTERSCRVAAKVVAIAEAGKRDIHERLGVPLERIEVVRPGVGERYGPRAAAEVDAFRQKEGLPEQFILHVGTLQPRKNIPLLIDAFALLRRRGQIGGDVGLVLVGGKGWLYDEIFAKVEQYQLEKMVRFTGYVSDEALPLWYNSATLLAFPSAYEGFGLPVVQALACGTPVVAANQSAIPEAGGEAALLFEPGEVESLASCMASVLQDETVRATMRAMGWQQAKKFSWAEAGRKMAEIYRAQLTL
ncbi:MAG TPA: glycosyltransferase family 1 protein [Anaerolineae bacterium]|nr:glycosyltransferase family 1 protein [Anaerolineae bacterium]